MKESQHTEWKALWRDDHLRWVCGFANAGGGVLVVGRDDRGRAVGVADAARLLEELPNKIRDLLGIVVEVHLREEAGRETLEIVTPAYDAPISYRGHYYQRSGSTLQELKGAALDRFLLRRYGRTWDGSPLPGIAPDALAADAFTSFRRLATHSGRLDAAALNESNAGLLDKLQLTEGRYLKRAAVLLFHPEPTRWVTGAFVKLGFFRAASELVYHDEITGHLFDQVHKTNDLLLTKYLKAAVGYDGLVRVERFPVPREALREALLNALIHRDYTNTAPIQIRVYDDRLVLWNPAVLPEGWTEKTLLEPHTSQPPNPLVANAFFRAGEIEAWGRGIERIFSACRAAGTPVPRLRLDAGGLWTEFVFDEPSLQTVGTTTSAEGEKTLVKTPVKTLVKTPERLLAFLQAHPTATLAEASSALGKSASAMERAARKLRDEGHLRYVGPQKGGQWEVLQ